MSAQKFGQYVIMGDMRITAEPWNGYNIVFDTTMPNGKDIDMYVYLPANCLMEKRARTAINSQTRIPTRASSTASDGTISPTVCLTVGSVF